MAVKLQFCPTSPKNLVLLNEVFSFVSAGTTGLALTLIGLTTLRFCDIILLNEIANFNFSEADMGLRFPIIPILFLGLGIFAIVIGVKFIVRFFRKEAQIVKANGNRISKKWYLIIISSVFVMLASWIFNMGWYRVILTWIPIPLIHTIAFLIINIKSANRVSNYKFLRKYIILSSVTYLVTYLFLPDGGDVGGMYAFFTIIRNDIITNIMMYISLVCFVVNIAVLFIECLQLKKCKSQ